MIHFQHICCRYSSVNIQKTVPSYLYNSMWSIACDQNTSTGRRIRQDDAHSSDPKDCHSKALWGEKRERAVTMKWERTVYREQGLRWQNKEVDWNAEWIRC